MIVVTNGDDLSPRAAAALAGGAVVAPAPPGADVTAVVPGPSPLIDALVLSGLPADRFAIESRAEDVDPLEPRTIVVTALPSALLATVGADRRCAVVRGDDVWRGRLGDAPDGEATVVLDGASPVEPATDDELRAALAGALARGATTRDAVAEVAAALGVPRRRVYDLANSTG